MPTSDPEFAAFKTLDLRLIASTLGYSAVPELSWSSSTVMKNGAGFKLIVTTAPDGNWVFWSPHDPSAKGSVIDLIQRELGHNYGMVRVELRPYLTGAASLPSTASLALPDLEPIVRDLDAARKAVEACEDVVFGQFSYLNSYRGLSAKTLSHPAFEGRIKTDGRNAVFPHSNLHGVCGGEISNVGWKSQIKHGTKGLWWSRIGKADNRLVVCENAEDALSWAQLHGMADVRLISTGGSLNPDQPDLIRLAIEKLPEGGVVTISTDNDDGGDMIAEIISSAYHAAGRSDLELVEHRSPNRETDWNDYLRSLLDTPTPGPEV